MINLISKDLRKEEVYVQIADCLECLQNITAESFDKINANLRSLNNDLIQIERRREVVRNKIEQIKRNSNKAIQIHSPFYYPAKEIKDQYKYESLIRCSRPAEADSKQDAVKCSISQPFELFHPDDLNEMLNFCDLDTFLKTERESLNFLQRQKLNKSTIPWNRINSISSLIIFNSSETAYIKTDQDSSIHEFKVASKQKKNEEDNELNFGNIAPPKSMTKKDKFESGLEQNLFRIDTQEAPKVLDNLPNDLPDLGAVADDIFFNEDAPIKFTSANFSPAEPEDRGAESKPLPSKLFRIFSFDQSSTSSIEEIKVPDAPKSSKHETTKKASGNAKQTAESIPVPPPLPADSSSFESSAEFEKKPLEKKPAVAIDNSRANLLDAIRKKLLIF